MAERIVGRKIVIINQAANYLTVGICNSFVSRVGNVALITGNIHEQEEELDENVNVKLINKYYNRPPFKKLLSYLLACWKIFWLLKTRFRKHEVLFISLPPMGYLLNLLLSRRFSMIIWDIYPDVLKITGMSEHNMIFRTWAKLNRKSFNKAYRVFTIGEKMAELLSKYIDSSKIIIQPIWSVFNSNRGISKSDNPFITAHGLKDKFVVQYSGNIGLTHKVEVMVQLASMMVDYKNIVFQVIGRGPRVPYLKKIVEDQKLPNCFFLPFQTDDMFPFSLASADLGIVILDECTSKGSVPSKSYNLMSFGIPSLYISASDSELFSYAEKYGHARCYSSDELIKAKEFIIEISNNKELWLVMSQNAEKAGKLFKRSNADKIVDNYLNNESSCS